jgi:ribosomal protein S18 acetylase RimI-like enzyme
VDLLTGDASELRIETLTAELAAEHADALLAMTADVDWDDWTRDNLLADRAGKWERSLLAVAADGSPVGWAVISETATGLHLHHIVIAPSARGGGVGATLMAELMDSAGDGEVTLKVHPDNAGALRFYDRLGFERDGTSDTGYHRLRWRRQEQVR